MTYVIHWDGVPVGKGRPRIFSVRGKIRTYTPDKTVDFEERIRFVAREAMEGAEPLDRPVRVEVDARFPIPKSMSKAARVLIAAGADAHTVKPDGDNVAKALLDAMNGIVYTDDKLVYDLRIRKRYAEKPGVTIWIQPQV